MCIQLLLCLQILWWVHCHHNKCWPNGPFKWHSLHVALTILNTVQVDCKISRLVRRSDEPIKWCTLQSPPCQVKCSTRTVLREKFLGNFDNIPAISAAVNYWVHQSSTHKYTQSVWQNRLEKTGKATSSLFPPFLNPSSPLSSSLCSLLSFLQSAYKDGWVAYGD